MKARCQAIEFFEKSDCVGLSGTLGLDLRKSGRNELGRLGALWYIPRRYVDGSLYPV